MYQFKFIQPTNEIWTQIEASCDSTCFHTKEWNAYLKRIGHRPICLSIYQRQELLGYFLAEKFLFGRFSIISSPMSNSGTYTMGLVALRPITQEERVTIYKKMAAWFFHTNQASVLQIDDWQFRITSESWIPYEEFHHKILDEAEINYSIRPTLCAPLNVSEDEMWKKLHYKSCKYSINKAHKLGLYVKEITRFEDIESFTKIHSSSTAMTLRLTT